MKINKVYTKKGDKGSTNLNPKLKITKDNMLVETLGSLDELNSFLGLAKSLIYKKNKFKRITKLLIITQKKLFDIGSEITTVNSKKDRFIILEEDVKEIEKEIDSLRKNLKSLISFVLPGTGMENAIFHISRTICRRCERNLVSLNKNYKINPCSLQYINRLSDLLFVHCSIITKKLKEKEKTWK